MSLFFVDSSCDLDIQQIKNLSIELINLPFLLDGKDKVLSDDFDYQKFYSKLRKGMMVDLKCLTEREYEKIFEPALQMDDIIYVCPSSEIFNCEKLLSARNKLLSKYENRRFEIIDSKNFSAGHGLFCFLLALKYHNGGHIDDILKYAESIRDTIAMCMVFDNIERIPDGCLINSSAMVSSTLNIKALVSINIDGKFKVLDKVSGRKRALLKLVQVVRQTGKNIADNPIVVTSTSLDEIEYIKNTLLDYFGQELKIFSYFISPTNSAIVGGGATGVAFNIHRKIN